MRFSIISIIFLLSVQIHSQSNCVIYTCDINDLDWLQQIKDDLLDPNQNPSIGGCVPSQSIQQCDYKGQTVIVRKPGACLLADEPSTVYDCEGNFLFAFGGFCITPDNSPCPGDIEAGFITSCDTIFNLTEGDIPQCTDPAIPTLGQWALIILCILFMIFGTISIKDKRISTAMIRF